MSALNDILAAGFDTSNYTTSMALCGEDFLLNRGRLLTVKPGELGLRQSDALFQHTKQLPEIAAELFAGLHPCISAVGVSTRPRSVEGSYMPCFLAGIAAAKTLAAANRIPCYEFSHQEGHIAAVLKDCGRLDLIDSTFLAWHLSGGTTELLLVSDGLHAQKIGGTEDLTAGQLIDRTGQLLDIPFPSGKNLDQLCGDTKVKPYPVKLRGLSFSLSGIQNQIRNLKDKDAPTPEIASYALYTISDAILRTTKAAFKQYGELPVVFSGGVASNSQLRGHVKDIGALFAQPQYSTDNAAGIAVLAYLTITGQWMKH